jgi:uncharacterized protein
MKWRGRRQSDNVEDVRGQGSGAGGGPFGGGGGFRMPGGGGGRGGGISIITLLIVGAIAWFVFGINPLQLMGMAGGGGVSLPGGAQTSPADPGVQQTRSPKQDELAQMSAVVLADTEDVWNEMFRRSGRTYKQPTLVLYSGSWPTACGQGDAAMGPFYCPGDNKVYIDLSFFEELGAKFGAAGDFAQAYVIAHEVGHHVQNLLGISAQTQRQRQQSDEETANRISVMVELQADCFAGVWAHHTQAKKQIMDPGDLEEALAAAAAVGDDTLQKRSRGFVVPESFTHGTSEQRKRWFTAGFQTGDVNRCDTFNAPQL